jgi:hypothetical protein
MPVGFRIMRTLHILPRYSGCCCVSLSCQAKVLNMFTFILEIPTRTYRKNKFMLRVASIPTRLWLHYVLCLHSGKRGVRYEALFKAKGDQDAVSKIFGFLGTPPEHMWRGLPFWTEALEDHPRALRQKPMLLEYLGEQGMNMRAP